MYNFIFWILFGTSMVFIILDTTRALDSDDWKANVLWHAGEIIITLTIFISVTIIVLFALDNEIVATDKAIMLISMTFLLIPIRKITDVILMKLVLYFINTDNAFAAKMDQRVVVKNSLTGKKELSVGIAMLYHVAIYLFFLMVYLMCSAFTFIPNSRLNVFLNTWENIIQKATGSTADRVIVMLYVITAIIIIVMIVRYFTMVYHNFMNWWTDNPTRKNVRKLQYNIITIFVLRKCFVYICVMTRYRAQDMLYWMILGGIFFILSFLKWYLARRRG